MAVKPGSRWSAIVRYIVCAVALFWLYRTTDWGQLKRVLQGADWRLAFIALVSFGPGPILIALRLQWLLAVQNVHLTLWQSIKVTFAGNFIINALPLGTSGGDTVKAFYIARETPYKHEAITAVFFDRVVGVLGLLLMSGAIVLLDWHNPAFASWGRIIGCSLIAFVVGAVIYSSANVRKWLRLGERLGHLPLSSHVQRTDRAVLVFRERWGWLLASIALTAALQAFSVFAYFLGGWALGLVGDRPWSALPVYLAYIPICFLTGALPIGVMEVTFCQLFAHTAGLGSLEAALSLSFFGRIMQLVWSLPGTLVVITAHPKGMSSEENETEQTVSERSKESGPDRA